MSTEYWITNSRFKFIALLLFLMFLVFMALIFFKADEITKNPCLICAKKLGENISCVTQSGLPVTRTFTPDYTFTDKQGIIIPLK